MNNINLFLNDLLVLLLLFSAQIQVTEGSSCDNGDPCSNFPPAPRTTCPSDWDQYGDYCYMKTKDKVNKEASMDVCKQLVCESHLPFFKKQQDWDTFNTKAVRSKMRIRPHQGYWLGLEDPGQTGNWEWDDGSKVDQGFEAWAGDNPDKKPSRPPFREFKEVTCARVQKRGRHYGWWDDACDKINKRLNTARKPLWKLFTWPVVCQVNAGHFIGNKAVPERCLTDTATGTIDSKETKVSGTGRENTAATGTNSGNTESGTSGKTQEGGTKDDGQDSGTTKETGSLSGTNENSEESGTNEKSMESDSNENSEKSGTKEKSSETKDNSSENSKKEE